jgi:hypothetical protein
MMFGENVNDTFMIIGSPNAKRSGKVQCIAHASHFEPCMNALELFVYPNIIGFIDYLVVFGYSNMKISVGQRKLE